MALTDSMKMFKLGLEGGSPRLEQSAPSPEWFYKGDGSSIVAPYAPIPVPGFALDGGEEPELVGLYLIGPPGNPIAWVSPSGTSFQITSLNGRIICGSLIRNSVIVVSVRSYSSLTFLARCRA